MLVGHSGRVCNPRKNRSVARARNAGGRGYMLFGSDSLAQLTFDKPSVRTMQPHDTSADISRSCRQ